MRKVDFKSLALTGVGCLAAGMAIKMIPKNFIAPAVMAGGAVLTTQKNADLQKVGTGLTAMGAVGTIGVIAEKVTALKKFVPQINGLGDLYMDENGNLMELGSLDNQPKFVTDEYGNPYQIEGLNGSDLSNIVGFEDLDYDDYEELQGLSGDLSKMV